MENQPFIFPAYRKRTIRRHCRIRATAAYFPERAVDNQAIINANHLPVTDTVVRKTLGAERRHVADGGVTDADLLVKAAQRCLEQSGLEADQLTKILVTKFVGDRILPMTASLVQRKLNCRTAMHAVDIEGGTNSFLTAADLAIRYISTTNEAQQNILILSGGLNNLPVSKTDPRLAFLFGDGAAAVLLETATEAHFLASYAYTNHAYFAAAGTRRMKMDAEISANLYKKEDYNVLYDLYQMGNWKDSADFYVQAAQITRDRLLEECRLSLEAIDWVLVTENNRRLRDLTLESLGVTQEKSLTAFAEYGNTQSAMLPILLDRAFSENLLQPGMHVMLISHGEGASGGGLIYRV
jgi:3-oxoacyl-[acyl-carrier-protein] synthase III